MAKKKQASGKADSGRIEYQASLNREEAARYLESLAQAVRQGRVVIGNGTSSFVAAVGEAIEVEVEARHRTRKARIELRLRFVTRGVPEGSSDHGAQSATRNAPAGINRFDSFSF